MITRLSGTLLDKKPPEVVIDVNGVGYSVLIPMTSLYHLPDVGATATLHTHLVVREDAHTLFGFQNTTDRQLFRELIKVNGVGPKLALTILSGMTTDIFIQCIDLGDSGPLTRIPGIGKKTAERLVMEMQDRLKKWDNLPNQAAALTQHPAAYQDAISALVALGYKEADAKKAVGQLVIDNQPSDMIIREALKLLA